MESADAAQVYLNTKHLWIYVVDCNDCCYVMIKTGTWEHWGASALGGSHSSDGSSHSCLVLCWPLAWGHFQPVILRTTPKLFWACATKFLTLSCSESSLPAHSLWMQAVVASMDPNASEKTGFLKRIFPCLFSISCFLTSLLVFTD